MKKEIEEKFQKLFEKKGDEHRSAEQERQAKREREDALREAFTQHVAKVIKPALEEARALLSRNGVEAIVHEGLFREIDQRIGLYVFTGDSRLGHPRQPDSAATQFVLTCDPHSGKVTVYEAHQMTGGRTAGPTGAIPLAQVTAEYIHTAVLRLMGG